MNIETKLKTWKKKTISKSELESLFRPASDEELFALVSEAVAAGTLSPVKAAGTNGNRTYPICLRYRIDLGGDDAEVLSEIAMLHPAMTQTGYLQSRPDLYVKYKAPLQKLNRHLFQERPAEAVSKKERSFDIFDEEKQLEDRSFCHLLDHLGLTPETLCYYETPEYCFHDYIPLRKARMTLLICENKDIWFNIRRRMYEDGASQIFGVPIDGVIFGGGNRVSETGALSAYTHFLGAEHVRYLYWGDIDRAGLDIYRSLVKNNVDLEIVLFVPGYEAMLRLAARRSIPDSEDHRRHPGDYAAIYDLFSGEEKRLLAESIQANRRIPQEIIHYGRLLEDMR